MNAYTKQLPAGDSWRFGIFQCIDRFIFTPYGMKMSINLG